MNLSSFAFESEVSESAMLKVSTDSMRDLGTDVKMPSLRLTSAGTGVTGPAGKWSRRAGRRRAAVYLCVQAPKSFWTGSSSSGPVGPAWSCTLSFMCRFPLRIIQWKVSSHVFITNGNATVGAALMSRNVTVEWMNACAVMSSGNHLFVRGWSSSAPITISAELIKVSLKWL